MDGASNEMPSNEIITDGMGSNGMDGMDGMGSNGIKPNPTGFMDRIK